MKNTGENPLSAARAEFQKNGATCARGVFDSRWVEMVRAGLAESANKPSHLSKTWTGDEGKGRFFQDGFAWNHVDPLRKFIFESPAAQLAADLMGSTRINLYMDHLLVRDANTNKATPWHHDTPYCFVDGKDLCTMWFPLDPVPAGEGLRLVSGSHKWGKMFLPVQFGSADAYAAQPGDLSPGEEVVNTVPDIDAAPGDYDVLSWELALGDCIVFYSNMLHSAPAHLAAGRKRRVYSTRWVGNDARYALRKWSVPPLPSDPGLKPGEAFGGELFPRII